MAPSFPNTDSIIASRISCIWVIIAIEVYDLRTSYGFSGFDNFYSCLRIYEFIREELETDEFWV